MKEIPKKQIEYSSNGDIYREYHKNKKGQYHGSYKSYYSNGNLWWQNEYKNNKWNGLFKNKSSDQSFDVINTQKEDTRFGLHIEFIK